MRALELNTGQEIQTLQETVIKRFETIEEIIETDEQGEKVKGQSLAFPVCARVQDDLPSFNCLCSNILREGIWY